MKGAIHPTPMKYESGWSRDETKKYTIFISQIQGIVEHLDHKQEHERSTLHTAGGTWQIAETATQIERMIVQAPQ